MRYATTAALLLLASVMPVAADSRDLVLDRLSRCYTLADTRQYLECLYAAAQPLRNELNLPPAPQAGNFAGLFSRPGNQAAYAPPAAPVSSVPQIAMPHPQVAEDRGMLSGVLSNVLGVKTVKVPPDQFGLRTARPGPGMNVDRITARMTQYSFNRTTGFFTVTLDNGQVWQQQVGDEHSPVWKKPASSYVVTISYGAMNTYNLTVAGERVPYKVQRIR